MFDLGKISLGAHQAEFEFALGFLKSKNTVARIWQMDASVWSAAPDHQKIIANSLGWLTVPGQVLERVAELKSFAEEIRSAGFTHAVVLGMGGSSLCPEVLRQSFGPKSGYPELLVLDSTVPAAVASIEAQVKLESTLFIVASKSGSTTEPQMFARYFYDRVKQVKGEKVGENFIAITDPGTLLENQAKEEGFRKTFINWADIGGRYSALSFFGMVPFALMGGDVEALLTRATATAKACQSENVAANPGAALGALLGMLASKGVDKLTLATSKDIASLGLWIEQLVAESTGKEGKGIVPIAGESLGEPKQYGKDRLFASIAVGSGDAETNARITSLKDAGFPVLLQNLADALDLGSTFFVWEFATAVACSLLSIDAFDQPNVQESKDNTKRLLGEFVAKGALPTQTPVVQEGALKLFSEDNALGANLDSAIAAHLKKVSTGDYVAITQYFVETPEAEALVQKLRRAVRARTCAAVTTGYGPRFLHSTGQLHKGGGNNGLFIQLTAEDAADIAIPREPFGFSILKQAQSLGDFESLVKHGRRAIRVDLGLNVTAGLKRLLQAVEQA
ncbi:MAG: glucose-6-phosphate isomerase [Acidobacteria bacterium]|nr:MAG: glucose-6-phosphate isomerase [Acidobacteriota bacterium]